MKVLVIDNYDSFVYNLVQYLGTLGAEPVVYRNDKLSLEDARRIDPDRLVISPGPGNPENPQYFGICRDLILELGDQLPILGVCLGHQGVVYAYGGRIVRASKIMHGKTSLIKHCGKGLFTGLPNPFRSTRYHSLVAERNTLPSCLEELATSLDDNEIMAVRHSSKPVFGVQFHPESILTKDGMTFLKNFLDGI